MKTSTSTHAPIFGRTWIGMIAVGAALFATIGCSRKDQNAPAQNVTRANASIEGGRIVVAGARPEFAAGAAPTTGGFLEDVRWDDATQTLQCKAWAPLDVRPDTVRFVLRDPFDRLRLSGTPVFTPMERTDVAAAHPQQPELRWSGFTASIPLTNLPAHPAWTDAVELYCLNSAGQFFRLARVDAPTRHTWDRRPDRFEVVIAYNSPDLTAPKATQGSLDVCEAGGAAGTVRLAGWASFDGQSPDSALIVQLPPSAAPAAIASCVWVPRADVRAAVDPQRAELDRSGFDLIIEVRGSLGDIRAAGALHVWSIDTAQHVTAVGLPALR